jgi:tRNA A37 threonylcarbamoyladenosine synthetase subunit TsaC/SUA5/YrdC
MIVVMYVLLLLLESHVACPSARQQGNHSQGSQLDETWQKHSQTITQGRQVQHGYPT